MNNIFINTFQAKAMTELFVLLTLFGYAAKGQQSSSGNLTIFAGTQVTLFGNHNFATGGAGIQPGIINTIRTSPMGVLNFASTANAAVGANDANHVDGYVRKLGAATFIFPVGDNGHYGPFAAYGEGTTGAYFFANPNTAITTMLSGGNYPALPTGGPFSTASLNSNLTAVSTTEFWDIDGNKPTKLTLTWDATSAISTLTGNALSKLIIAGWNGSQWVAIPSAKDAESVLGGASSFSAGSITTNAAIVPDTYTAYTLATSATALPVKLVTFVATKEAKTIHLQWSTAEEINADYFNIERSPDARNWQTIGNVDASGESKTRLTYEFTDDQPVAGINYYRLKMTDNDDTFAYSTIRTVTVEDAATQIVSVYPNPATDVIFLKNTTTGSDEPGIIREVSIVSLTGTVAYRSSSFSTSGISVRNLSTGIYFVKIINAGGILSTHKILVSR